jgi:predicted nucleic acid-binding protein
VQLLISDANILIDLEEGLLAEHLFKLPYEFCIPDILFEEELAEHHQHFIEDGLELRELQSETMRYAMELIPKYIKTSRNDCFALALATQEKCPLLTGDKALRNAAESESVMVKGTIWLVESMVRHKLIDFVQARNAYSRMKEAGRRLPWGIAEAVLKELESEAE